jgi:hypothetical protein
MWESGAINGMLRDRALMRYCLEAPRSFHNSIFFVILIIPASFIRRHKRSFGVNLGDAVRARLTWNATSPWVRIRPNL